MPATKIDTKRDLHALYSAGRSPVLVEVPELTYAMVDGHGDPTTAAEYERAVEAVFTVAYAVKFALRDAEEVDYGVLPLEGLWWADDMDAFLADGDRSTWHWTMMICQPLPIRDVVCEAALRRAAKKIPDVRERVRIATLAEGQCAQVMHYGAYADEGPTIAALHAYIAEHGLERAGRHHEIYLGDPRRTAPERLRTIIRQPVR